MVAFSFFKFLTSVNVNSPTLLFLLFKVVLSLCSDFNMNFRNNLSIFVKKKALDFNRDCIEPEGQFGKYCFVLMILSLILEHRMSIYLVFRLL